MDLIQKFTSQIRDRLVTLLLINNLIVLADWFIVNEILHLTGYWAIFCLMIVPILSMTLLPWISASSLIQPTKLIWQAILHIAPDTANTPAPDIKSSRLGQDLVANLVSHIYQLASVAENVEKLANKSPFDIDRDFVANRLPLPLIILDKEKNIMFANETMLNYIKRSRSDIVGQNVYSVLDLSFSSEHTFDEWLKAAETSKAIDSRTWDRVRLNLVEENITRYFDMVAYYNKNNPQNFETMLILFDRTALYSKDEQEMSFIAITVHELRTPITLLRGYIEVLEEELDGKVSDELAGFLQKTSAAAQQLAAFANNILNVANIENDHLTLKLREEQWPEILNSAVNDMRLRAQVHGIELELKIDDNIPTVAVDRVSIYEVVSNLIGNAIKYSGTGKHIIITSYLGNDGLVQTTVQDFGIGIPESVMPNLFEKFYRSHRSQAQVSGNGLGLYLSKTIVSAHDGHIWVRSKEGQGSVFGFSLLPYSQITSDHKDLDNGNITRSAHGWVKNHSLYRR